MIKAADRFHTQTTRPNEMWQTDFTYFKIIGWGWMYLSTVLGDFSRYIIAWKLCSTMRAEDVTDTLDLALAASGCDQARVHPKPRLLSDNGPSYIAGELADYIKAQRMSHVRCAPFHSQTQGRIERWHQTLRNRILLENYFPLGDLEAQIEAFAYLSKPPSGRQAGRSDSLRRAPLPRAECHIAPDALPSDSDSDWRRSVI